MGQIWGNGIAKSAFTILDIFCYTGYVQGTCWNKALCYAEVTRKRLNKNIENQKHLIFFIADKK